MLAAARNPKRRVLNRASTHALARVPSKLPLVLFSGVVSAQTEKVVEFFLDREAAGR